MPDKIELRCQHVYFSGMRTHHGKEYRLYRCRLIGRRLRELPGQESSSVEGGCTFKCEVAAGAIPGVDATPYLDRRVVAGLETMVRHAWSWPDMPALYRPGWDYEQTVTLSATELGVSRTRGLLNLAIIAGLDPEEAQRLKDRHAPLTRPLYEV